MRYRCVPFGMCHQPPYYTTYDDRPLCEVKQPLKDVSAVTPTSNGGSCGEQSFVHLPGDRRQSAKSDQSSAGAVRLITVNVGNECLGEYYEALSKVVPGNDDQVPGKGIVLQEPAQSRPQGKPTLL